MAEELAPFFTIGHSNRPFSEFVELLRQAEIELVADVRTIPRSRANPQYHRSVLPRALSQLHFDYEPIAALGGRRSRQPDVLPEVNAFWTNTSFRNYADYAMSAAFRSGLDSLRELGRERRCAIMCAEAVWWRCHRRIIADYLLEAGETVLHIMEKGRIEPAQLTAAAKPGPHGTLVYPASR